MHEKPMAEPPHDVMLESDVQPSDTNDPSTQQYKVAPLRSGVPVLQLSELLSWSGPSVPEHEYPAEWPMQPVTVESGTHVAGTPAVPPGPAGPPSTVAVAVHPDMPIISKSEDAPRSDIEEAIRTGRA